MDRYELRNASDLINGYYIPRQGETKKETFSRAQKETVENLKNQLQCVESLVLDKWYFFK